MITVINYQYTMTHSFFAEPLSPTDLKVEDNCLKWKKPDGGVDKYKLVLRSGKDKRTEISQTESFSMTDMTPGAEFEVSLTTISNGISSDPTKKLIQLGKYAD